ncbi:MAG: Mrp/NBP35 family ATP-binding protein [Polyangiaceae bacterium]|nr:Mrp/NBP35 family ATP-binding protein [Polyangiaceae bacterium]
MPVTHEQLLAALERVEVANTNKSVASFGMVQELEVSGDTASVSLVMPLHSTAMMGKIQDSVVQTLVASGASKVDVKWSTQVKGRIVGDDDPVPQAANVVIVMSGKGGVGKSTVAVNMALSLVRSGARVGLLDADMYGPSLPVMMGTMDRPVSDDGTGILPVEKFGLKMMSIGFFLDDPRDAVVWRGPMLHGALMQFLRDVRWGVLDYLLLDLPPGTGDIPLTLSQKLQVTGAVIVTTPQAVALEDVYKSVSMCQKVNIPVLGVVENQSYFLCDSCNKRHDIYGQGGGEKVAAMAFAPLLAQVPTDYACRQAGDSGTPVVMASPDSASAIALREASEALALRVACHHADAAQVSVTIDRSGGKNRHLPVVS